MSVHKNDRGESDFEVLDHAVVLKKKIRELSVIRNFGLKVRESKEPRNYDQWSEKSKADWKKKEADRLEKLKLLDSQFLAAKRRDIETDLREMIHGITKANSIKYPVNLAEADERRIWQDRAIAACECLRMDLQDIMDTLPLNKNWMTQIEPEIESEINLIKAWRKSDNPKRRAIREADMKRWLQFIEKAVAEKTVIDESSIEVGILKDIYRVFYEAVERSDPSFQGKVTPVS